MKKNLILVLVFCVLSLLLGELIIRILGLGPQLVTNIGYFRFVDNPKIVYEFIPGSLVDGSTINTQGFKDSEFMQEKPSGCVRIAMLGDSFTQGMYVKSEDTFCGQLQKMLNESTVQKNNLRYEVMNFGVGGYNLEAEVETLRTKVLQYSPDIVILNFFSNDIEPIPGLYVFFLGNNEFDKNQRTLFLKKYIYNHRNPVIRLVRNALNKSKLYLFIMYRLDSYRKDRISYNIQGHHDWARNVFFENLSQINELKLKYGFKFLICIHHSLLYAEDPNNLIMEKTAQAFRYPYFYVLPYYKNRFNTLDDIKAHIQVKKDDPVHFNELGHRIIAEAFLVELKRNRFIDMDSGH